MNTCPYHEHRNMYMMDEVSIPLVAEFEAPLSPLFVRMRCALERWYSTCVVSLGGNKLAPRVEGQKWL